MRNLRNKILLSWSTAIACAGCNDPDARTEIVIVVDSNLAVPVELDSIDIAVTGPRGDRMQSATADLGAGSLPRTLGVVHEGGPLGPLTVVVSGKLGAVERVTRTASVFFLAGRTVALRMFLVRECVGRNCPDQTCAEGGSCRPIEVDPDELFDWTGSPPRLDGGAMDQVPTDRPRDDGAPSELPREGPPPDAVVPSTAQVVSGFYMGNGAVQAITGLDFRPAAVIVSSSENGLAGEQRRSVIRTSTMPFDLSKSIVYNDADPLYDRIVSLDADGFAVGHPAVEDMDARATCVNHVGVTYYWVAFRAAPGELVVDSYVGNMMDNRNIAGIGFQPDYVIVLPEGTGWSHQRSSTMRTTESIHFEGGVLDNAIQALLPDGFQVGDDADVNGARAYHYLAWRAVAGSMAVGSYSGDGNDDRSIGGAGFEPEYLLVFNGSHQRSAAMGRSTRRSLVFVCYNDCFVGNHLQALEPDGFQVGSSNANNNGETYDWAAFGPARP